MKDGHPFLSLNGEPMLLQEGELIPISPLKCNFSANNLEEPASAQAQRVLPLQDRPLSVFKYVLNNTDHLGCGEFFGEHISDSGEKRSAVWVF